MRRVEGVRGGTGLCFLLAVFLALSAGCGRGAEARAAKRHALEAMAERAEPARLAIEEFQRQQGRPPADADEAGIRLPADLTYWTAGKEWSLTWRVNPDSWLWKEFLSYHSDETYPEEVAVVGRWCWYAQD